MNTATLVAPVDLRHPAFRDDPHPLLRERISAVTDELIDALPAHAGPDGRYDRLTGLAQPLPVRIICDVLGLPHEDFAQTKAWSDARSWIVDPRGAARAARSRGPGRRGDVGLPAAPHRTAPRLEMADTPPRWRKLINLRGLEALPLNGRQAEARSPRK